LILLLYQSKAETGREKCRKTQYLCGFAGFSKTPFGVSLTGRFQGFWLVDIDA
jgi:hypothetical protein